MDPKPVVIQEGTREWETWPDEEVAQKGLVYWRTLISGDVTRSEALTMGIGKMPPGEALHKHRHQQAATDRQEVFQAGHHHLVDPQPRQRPPHPHHHQD